MKNFSVIITRQSNPTDSTNGWHGADFKSRSEAVAYAESEMEKGYEKAAVILHVKAGQRRILTIDSVAA